MIPVAEARSFVLGACTPLPARPFSLDVVAGHVLAEDVVAAHPLPSFDNSAMDGYAVRAEDTVAAPVRLRVVGTITAGDGTKILVSPGTAVRIMTGAPMPPGADAVCVVESTRTEDAGASVVVERSVRSDDNVRHIGEELEPGARVLAAGTYIGPWQVGVLASLGCSSLRAHPRPTVAVIATGDELVAPGTKLARGKIFDSNRPALLAQLRADGFDAVEFGTVRDDEELLSETIKSAASCDAIVTSGGVSVGDHDLVKVVLEKLSGATMRWMQVAVRPAKPFAFGMLASTGTPMFGLPGNPVAAFASYEMFVRPALRKLAGFRQLDRPIVVARAAQALLRRPDGKLHLDRVFARAEPDGAITVVPAGSGGAHGMSAVAGANALAVLPDGAGVRAGDLVEILLLEPDRLDASALVRPWWHSAADPILP